MKIRILKLSNKDAYFKYRRLFESRVMILNTYYKFVDKKDFDAVELAYQERNKKEKSYKMRNSRFWFVHDKNFEYEEL